MRPRPLLSTAVARCAVALSLWLAACNDPVMPPPTTQTDMAVPDLADLASMMPQPDLINVVFDMVRPPAPLDGGTFGMGGIFCGIDRQGKNIICRIDKPYCCYMVPGSNTGTCVDNLDGCPHWIGCTSNVQCPPDHPLCCRDNKPNLDCRVACESSLCGSDDECPREHPKCLPEKGGITTCQ